MDLKTQESPSLKTKADAFYYFLQRMDIEMIDLLLDDKITYQDFEKKKFINLLDDAFDKFTRQGDTFLLTSTEHCNSKTCHYKLKRCLLTGNESENFMNILVETEGDRITDLLECYSFKYSEKPKLCGKRIYIDPFREPF